MKKDLTAYELVMRQNVSVASDNINELKDIIYKEIQHLGHIDIYWLCSLTFHYGFICGKKEERKRRKKLL